MGIKMKRSAIAGKAPVVGDLELGELAINTYDGRVYLKKDNGTPSVVQVGGHVIGEDVQAYDADLAAIAAIAGTSGLVRKTGAGTFDLDTAVYITSPFPAGTAMLFQQTNAPTGWTKQTTHNDKVLRVVSGAAGSGGSTAFSSVFASRTPAGTIANTTAAGTISSTTAGGTVGSTTLTEAQMPSHTHSLAAAAGTGGGLDGVSSRGGLLNTNPTGGGGSHTHSFTGTSHGHTFTGTSHSHTFTGTAMDFAVQYVDLIIATKD